MSRFAAMIAEGMRERGHQVEVWTAHPIAHGLPVPKKLKKWLGYVDQFVIFPLYVRYKLRRCASDTLFIFTDEALGPWVPLVADRFHVIHNQGFFALRSSLGEFPGSRISWTGRMYQQWILRGFSLGKNFISISDTCKQALTQYLPSPPEISRVVYNGLNYPFTPLRLEEARIRLSKAQLHLPEQGFLVHVGGNQHYKNRAGVLRLYQAYCALTESPLPLWMIGAAPTPGLLALAAEVSEPGSVRFHSGLDNAAVHAAYASAHAMIYPSLWEGFGWPVAEAMACGCLVVTTDRAPMNVVGADAATYIDLMPETPWSAWAQESAEVLLRLLRLPEAEKEELRRRGYRQAKKYSADAALNAYQAIYQELATQ